MRRIFAWRIIIVFGETRFVDALGFDVIKRFDNDKKIPQKNMFSLCDGGFSAWESAFFPQRFIRCRVHRVVCALFRLGTNRLLKISGRGLRERERKRKNEASRRVREKDRGRDHTLCNESYSVRSPSRDAPDSSYPIPFFARKAHKRVRSESSEHESRSLPRKNICLSFQALVTGSKRMKERDRERYINYAGIQCTQKR